MHGWDSLEGFRVTRCDAGPTSTGTGDSPTSLWPLTRDIDDYYHNIIKYYVYKVFRK